MPSKRKIQMIKTIIHYSQESNNIKKMKHITRITILAILSISMMVSCNSKQNYKSVDEMVNEAALSTQAVNVEQLMEKIDNGDMILLVDVREPNEYNAGYIPGAVNIPRGVLEFKINNEAFWEEAMLYMPLPDEEIIVYCRKGKRSILAAQTLQQLGYSNVTFVTDGWKKWEMTYPLIQEKNLDNLYHDDGGEVGGC